MKDTGTAQRPRGIAPPTGTWVSMLLALVLTLLLSTLTSLIFAWFGNATFLPFALIFTIIALGVVGAVFALRRRRYLWALISAPWGLFLFYALYTITLRVWGP